MFLYANGEIYRKMDKSQVRNLSNEELKLLICSLLDQLQEQDNVMDVLTESLIKSSIEDNYGIGNCCDKGCEVKFCSDPETGDVFECQKGKCPKGCKIVD